MRLSYIDQLKGVGILLVVMGHICQGRFMPQSDFLFRFIYSFHMPLFIFLSGIFANKVNVAIANRNLIPYLKKKFFQLMIPFFIFGSLRGFMHGNFVDDFLIGKGHAGYWFFLVLFVLFIIVGICEEIKYKSKIGNWIYIIPYGFILLLEYIYPNVLFSELFSIHYLYFNYPFFLLGLYLGKSQFLQHQLSKPYVFEITIVIYIVFFSINYNQNHLYLKHVTALCMVLFLYGAMRYYQPSDWFFRKLLFVGSKSMDIYVLHYFIFPFYPKNIYNHLLGWFSNVFVCDTVMYVLILISTVLFSYICISISSLLKRSSWISRYVFGAI